MNKRKDEIIRLAKIQMINNNEISSESKASENI
jgi:hypothetical protein